jgi:uncharacterized membrane protein HdeD (DUF308 family)
VPTIGRILLVILGVLGVLVGLVLIVRPGESVLTFVWVLGFWWTLSGVLQIARGITDSEGRAWNLCWGALGLIAGIIILASPDIGLVTLVWIVSIGLIFQGSLEIAAAFAARKLHKEGVL